MICGLLQSLEQPSLQVTEAWTEKELQSEGAAQHVLGLPGASYVGWLGEMVLGLLEDWCHRVKDLWVD